MVKHLFVFLVADGKKAIDEGRNELAMVIAILRNMPPETLLFFRISFGLACLIDQNVDDCIHFSWGHVYHQNTPDMTKEAHLLNTSLGIHIHQYELQFFLAFITEKIVLQLPCDLRNFFDELLEVVVD